MLSNTARKLNLKKISKMFKTIPVGATCNGENTEIKNTFQSTSDVVGVSWVGENCTVKETKAECDNQSEGALESGPKRHLGLGVAKDCDWRGKWVREWIGGCDWELFWVERAFGQ